jgi:hypothetical protein
MPRPHPRRLALLAAALLAATLPAFPAAADPADPGVAAVDGALTAGDPLVPGQGNGGYDVLHYDIDLEYLPAEDDRFGATLANCWSPGLAADLPEGSIRATTVVTATTTGAPLKSFGLDFKGLEITSLTVDGAPAAYTRIQDAAADQYKLVVAPAAPVSGTFTVAVAYEGTPEDYAFEAGFEMAQGWLEPVSFCDSQGRGHVNDGGATGIGQPAGTFTWFPNNTTPADKATYTTVVTVPADYTPVGIGVLQSVEPTGDGRSTWTWDEPMPSTTFGAVVSIGQYSEHTGTVRLAHGDVPIHTFATPAMDASITDTSISQDPIAFVADVVAWLEAQWGDYQPAAAGYIMTPLGTGWSLETLGRPVLTWVIDQETYVHEMAHMWAGNSVSVTEWSDLWLAEGYATYAQWLWNEAHGGTTATALGRTYYDAYPAGAALWQLAVADPADRGELWGWGSYYGGALALAALRAGVGDDVFADITRQWFARYANGNASTQDYLALAEEVSGRDLDAWAGEFLYSTAKPAAWPDLTTYPETPETPEAPVDGFFALLRQILALLVDLIERLLGLF